MFSLQAVINDSVMVIIQMMIEHLILMVIGFDVSTIKEIFQSQLLGAW